jgi:hypothetical protein
VSAALAMPVVRVPEPGRRNAYEPVWLNEVGYAGTASSVRPAGAVAAVRLAWEMRSSTLGGMYERSIARAQIKGPCRLSGGRRSRRTG